MLQIIHRVQVLKDHSKQLPHCLYFLCSKQVHPLRSRAVQLSDYYKLRSLISEIKKTAAVNKVIAQHSSNKNTRIKKKMLSQKLALLNMDFRYFPE